MSCAFFVTILNIKSFSNFCYFTLYDEIFRSILHDTTQGNIIFQLISSLENLIKSTCIFQKFYYKMYLYLLENYPRIF